MRFVFLAVLAMVAYAEPCTTGTAACTEKLPMGEPGRFVLVYRSHPLTKANAKITRALVGIHGSSRNADDYFPSSMAAAFLAGALDNTLVIAPRFAGVSTGGRNSEACNDKLAPGELAFSCSGSDWRGGGAALESPGVNSYGVMDELIRMLADKKRFPKLRHIVLMGHSAGGQYVSRYVAAAKPTPQSVSVRYIISNSSSYLYLDPSRPGPTNGCAGFDQWKYGMENRTGYAAPVSLETMKQNLVGRDVVYLLGEYDVTPQFGFDGSCGAMAQGPNRLQRGLNYFDYITTKYGAKHKVIRVPNCGHNSRCMLVANEAREVLFP
jgi:pimeloyl-ACP methyl ester carboxylesterase